MVSSDFSIMLWIKYKPTSVNRSAIKRNEQIRMKTIILSSKNASAPRNNRKKKSLLYFVLGLATALYASMFTGCASQPAANHSYGGGIHVSSKDSSRETSGDESKNGPPPGVRVVDFGKDLERWDEANQEIREAVRNMEPTVYVKNLVRFDWSNLDVGCFWVSGIVDHIGPIEPEAGQTYAFGGLVSFQYNSDMSDISSMQKEIDRVTAAILAKIPKNADEWETAEIVHDEICRLAAYDQSLQGKHIRDIYGALVKRSAVCVGYAYAFDYVLAQTPNGPACITRESADRSHAWNEIILANGEGKSYLYIDPTWNDSDMTDASGNPYIFRDYFCVSPDELEGLDDSHSIGIPGDGKDPTPFYYHVRQGCYLTAYNETETIRIFRLQYQTGSNMLTIRFQNPNDYAKAKQWTDNNCAKLNRLLSGAGYTKPYLSWWNDTLHILNIGLNPPAA